MTISPTRARRSRVRMSRVERRKQLIEVGRELFAEKGFDGVSVEEIAIHAEVSKPVVYEHFGGKEGLYAAVVEIEVRLLDESLRQALLTPNATPRALIELSCMALLDYIDDHEDGFRILSRDSAVDSAMGSYATILSDIAARVEGLLAEQFRKAKYPATTAPIYAQMLTGLVALTGQWWLDSRETTTLTKEQVAAELVNLAWNGMRNLSPKPVLVTRRNRDR